MSVFSLPEKPDRLGREAFVLFIPALSEFHKAPFAL